MNPRKTIVAAAATLTMFGAAAPGLAGAATVEHSSAITPALMHKIQKIAKSVNPGGTAHILRTRPHIDLHLVGHGVKITGNTSYSSNWSGYVDTGENYNYVLGYWKVPEANCSSFNLFNSSTWFSSSSTWVGLDGWGDGTVEQLGTSTDCVGPVHDYNAWTEMYPAGEDSVPHSVSPGDEMGAYVDAYDSGTQYYLVMEDFTQGWEYWTTGTASPADSDLSAEWITERPSCSVECNYLTNFGTTTFTGAYAEGNGKGGSISSFPNQAIDMDNGNLEASVGSLTASGTSFLDTWLHG
jgi:hypothetical protein